MWRPSHGPLPRLCHVWLLCGEQAWLSLRAPWLQSAALEQRLWARTLPAVGGVMSMDQARAALYRDLARGYRDRCLQVLNPVYPYIPPGCRSSCIM